MNREPEYVALENAARTLINGWMDDAGAEEVAIKRHGLDEGDEARIHVFLKYANPRDGDPAIFGFDMATDYDGSPSIDLSDDAGYLGTDAADFWMCMFFQCLEKLQEKEQ